MDKPGVRKVPGGSGEQGKIEETGYEIICGAPTTLVIKGEMMMVMMMMMTMMIWCAQSTNVSRLAKYAFRFVSFPVLASQRQQQQQHASNKKQQQQQQRQPTTASRRWFDSSLRQGIFLRVNF